MKASLACAVGLILTAGRVNVPRRRGSHPRRRDRERRHPRRRVHVLARRSSDVRRTRLLLASSCCCPAASPHRVQFRTKTERNGVIELGPVKIGTLTLRWRITQKNPSLVERTLDVSADAAQKFSATLPLDTGLDGRYESFSGEEKGPILYNCMGGAPYHADIKGQTFPLAMLRATDRAFGIIADSPGLWENRCQVLLDPSARRLAIFPGNGCGPYSMGERNFNYKMDGWQSLAAGETQELYDVGFRQSGTVALRCAARRASGAGERQGMEQLRGRSHSPQHLAVPVAEELSPSPAGRPTTSFHSGIGYGWIQWVSDGFWAALGLNDPEKDLRSLSSSVYLSSHHLRGQRPVLPYLVRATGKTCRRYM